MTSARVVCVAVDARDPEALAGFWCAVLGSEVLRRWRDAHGTPYVEIGFHGAATLLFQQVGDVPAGKNRLHLDVAPLAGGQDGEVARLVALGAAVVDEAPGNRWIVLADPEGNLFCVLPPDA